MSDTTTQSELEKTIAEDLNARAENAAAGLASTPIAEHREAWAKMTPTSTDDHLPSIMLVGDKNAPANTSVDALHPADIKVGGWNFLVGAKVPGQAEGVRTRMGKVYDKALDSGWNWKIPLIEKVVMMPTSTIADTVRAQAVSHDLQQVTTELTVPFHMKQGYGAKVYKAIGTLEKVEAVIINPGVLEGLKAVTAKYTAEELITKRETVKNEVEEHLRTYVHAALKQRGIEDAIEIGKLAITDFRFSDEYNRSIEMKVKAAQDALRAESEKRQRVTESEGIRDAQKAKAEGEAYAIDVKSKAEAEAIKRRAEALKINPKLIDLNTIEKWDGKLPTFTGGGVVPFLNTETIKKAAEEQPKK